MVVGEMIGLDSWVLAGVARLSTRAGTFKAREPAARSRGTAFIYNLRGSMAIVLSGRQRACPVCSTISRSEYMSRMLVITKVRVVHPFKLRAQWRIQVRTIEEYYIHEERHRPPSIQGIIVNVKRLKSRSHSLAT